MATIGWVALAMQLAVTIGISVTGSSGLLVGLWRFFGYFTILTNLMVAIMHTRIARHRWPGGPAPDVSAITGMVLAIAVVGVVYDVLLSSRAPAMGAVWWAADRLLHYVVPMLTVVWWWRYVPASVLRFSDPARWLAYPLAYLAYAVGRGAVDGWYPYFFIDVTRLGLAQVLTNAAALALAMFAAGTLVVVGVRLRGRRHGMA